MIYKRWMKYLTGEMKVPYISEIREDTPSDIRKEYEEYRKHIERIIDDPEQNTGIPR